MNKALAFSLIIVSIFLLLLTSTSCNRKNKYSPKPRAFFRIDLPQKGYQMLETDCPYEFSYPIYSYVKTNQIENPCWINIDFPSLHATIYLTYKTINNDLHTHTEDTRDLVYKHTVKAESINETAFENDTANAYGVLYSITGNVASNIQFYMTDSSSHFLRGSLYFNTRPNKDSLAPIIDFIQEDIIQIMETTRWK
jgi:gliding motility-associated lipoprotein GldD